jgi:hypothetical protein
MIRFWYSIHICSMLLRLNSVNDVYLCHFYLTLSQYMCGAPEHLKTCGARTFLLCYQNNYGSETIVVESVEQT